MARLSTRIKLFYGVGFASRGIKDGLFQLFLFFYFSQVLGLDAALAGTAALIALLFDAVSDPLIGYISDNWKSEKWGRRHPFMFVSAIPLAVFTYILFAPPHDLGQTGLFWWLCGFSILVRIALTFFIVPHMSLGAEMTTDYDERTTVTAYRIMFAAFVAPVTIILGLTTFFSPTEEITNGLFRIDAYSKFAFLCAMLMIIAILVSAIGTRSVIPGLPKASKKQSQLGLNDLLKGFVVAFKMKSFRNLILYMMTTYVGIGLGVIFTTYFITYFFGLTEKELAFLPIASAAGGIFSLFLAPFIGSKLDKKWGTIVSTAIFAICFSAPYNLRFFGLFPDNGTPMLLPAYLFTLVLAYIFLWIALSLANSMMAEVVDQYDLQTGNRQEGLFFATMSFAYKCTTGFGQFTAGILLTIIAFPKQAAVEDVSPEAINGLGIIGGPILLSIYLLSIAFIYFYPINKDKYREIREGLDKRQVSETLG